jgi:hypothetical protein
MNTRRALRTLAALTPPVVGTMLAAVAGLLLARATIDHRTLAAAGDAIGNHLQTLGTVYAVLLAFVVVVVWQQFNDARQQVENEANELIDLYRTAAGLPAPERQRLQAQLRGYVDTVLDTEWSAMVHGDSAAMDAAGHLLDDAWDALHPFDPERECEKALFAESLARFNDLSDARAQRLTSARTRMPLALRFLMYIGAALVTGTTYLLWIEPFWLHAIVTASLAGAVSHVIYVIEDLDNAFAGDWQVAREAFARARAFMTRRDAAGVTSRP